MHNEHLTRAYVCITMLKSLKHKVIILKRLSKTHKIQCKITYGAAMMMAMVMIMMRIGNAGADGDESHRDGDGNDYFDNVASFVCLFVGFLTSQQHVYLRDGSAQTILRAATLRKKLQMKLSTSPSHSILTPGRPVPALTL